MHTYVHTERAKHTPGYVGYFLPGLQFKQDGLYYSVAQLAIMIIIMLVTTLLEISVIIFIDQKLCYHIASKIDVGKV